jgi:hypothetical protein
LIARPTGSRDSHTLIGDWTERLTLRWLDAGDAALVLELLNDPSWLRYIGDRGVRTISRP